jgi:hypothetical protein
VTGQALRAVRRIERRLDADIWINEVELAP